MLVSESKIFLLRIAFEERNNTDPISCYFHRALTRKAVTYRIYQKEEQVDKKVMLTLNPSCEKYLHNHSLKILIRVSLSLGIIRVLADEYI